MEFSILLRTTLLDLMSLFPCNIISADGNLYFSDTRDNIIQALACFTCYERSLKVLEELPNKR